MASDLYMSKSRYCQLWQCPKILWLLQNKPEERETDTSTESRMQVGREVGELAKRLFGPYVDVSPRDGERLDLQQMIRNTKAEMQKQTPVICEASFACDGLYCAVDILKKEPDGWAIYEVKSSTHEDKTVYLADVGYQKYVLEHCGVQVTKVSLVCLNKDYVYDGQLDLNHLFRITDVTDGATEEAGYVADLIETAIGLLTSEQEPVRSLSEHCRDPYPCAFWNYCTNPIGSPSVFDLYRMPFKKKLSFYQQGLTSYQDLAGSDVKLNEKQRRQISFGLTEQGDHTEPEQIRVFLSQLSYPLYFLDFETVQPAIPKYIGTKPYDQIPFQYSLHYIEQDGGELKHSEFLAEPEDDPRRALAEQLCADIPRDVCVTAYNKAFECTRIKELAEAFPDLADHLLNIRDNIVDLLTPFQSGWYYNRAMGGSFSIKSVLPALFPDDPALDYHNLDGIHNGSEAMNAFPMMVSMEPKERAEMRKNLLKYCELDTFAMVKVWEKLCEKAR